MIDIQKYFGGDYEKGGHDCWTLLQDIYHNEHGLTLPDFPIFGLTESEYPFYMVANMYVEKINTPEAGCIVHRSGIIDHVGYCVDGKHFLHRTMNETRCDKIRLDKCEFYRVLKR